MLKIESYRKGIVLSTLFNVFNKGLVFLNSLLIAFYFGTAAKMDIYFYAYNTLLIVSTFITGINTTVVIPQSIRMRVEAGETTAFKFLNVFIFGYITLTVFLSLAFIYDPIKTFIAISKYEASTLASQLPTLLMTIPLLLLITLTTFLTDILTSYRYFTAPVFVGIINAVCCLMFVVFYHNVLDVKSILVGQLVAYSINIILLIYIMRKHLKWNFSIRNSFVPKKIWQNIFIVQTGNFVSGLGNYAPFYFLSGVGIGIIASLNYAQQIVAQPVSFITAQISAVSRIKLSELYALKDRSNINDVFQSTVKFLIFILFPISGLLFLYSHEIITVLFKRGSFNETSVEQSSQLLKFLALSLPFTAIAAIAANLYFAAQLIKLGILYQVFSNLLLIALMAICIRKIGYIGYPIASLIVNIINVLVVYIFCVKKFPFIHYSEILKYLLLVAGLHATLVTLLKGLKILMASFSDFSVLTIGGTIYIVLLLLVSFAMRINVDFNNFISNTFNTLLRRTSNGTTRN